MSDNMPEAPCLYCEQKTTKGIGVVFVCEACQRMLCNDAARLARIKAILNWASKHPRCKEANSCSGLSSACS
jgi:hypothetical protein